MKTKKDKVGQRRTNLSIANGVLLKTEKKLSNVDSAVKVKRRHGIQKFAFSLEMKDHIFTLVVDVTTLGDVLHCADNKKARQDNLILTSKVYVLDCQVCGGTGTENQYEVVLN